MRRAIGIEQPRAIDRGIDLRRRERGMAQKLLDRAQIAAPPEKMRREGMAQRMRRRGFGQAERPAQALDRELNDARRQRTALGADEQGLFGAERIGAKFEIGFNAAL